MTENIVTGKKYRILTDAANDIWDRISFWAKASDVQYDDNTTAEANKAVAILKRNASYTIGTVAYEPSAPSWVLLRCTQAGTTAAVIPSTYSTISSVGTVITDGTARFTVYDVRPSGTLSNSGYQVPAMSLVYGLNAELTANGNKFYFDYQNDKYGYNTSASREAATFVPFGGTLSETLLYENTTPNVTDGGKSITLSDSIGNYTFIKFVYKAKTTVDNQGSVLYTPEEVRKSLPNSATQTLDCPQCVICMQHGYRYARRITYTSDTELAYTATSAIGGSYADNTCTILLAVYGLK